MTKTKSKVYIEILRYIRTYILENQLTYGEKIPSERELAEKLKVGRSSVREALRSLELLGMIETRRGEGTFLNDFREHKLLEILGTFLLEDAKVKEDIIEMNALLEWNALQLILENDSKEELLKLATRIEQTSITRYQFMREIISITNNHLLIRIWKILNEYVTYICQEDQEMLYPSKKYSVLVSALMRKEKNEVYAAYHAVSLKENVE